MAFAPETVAPASVGEEDSAIVAVGTETGRVELWAVPAPGGDPTRVVVVAPRLVLALPDHCCHVDAVKRLAWRPPPPRTGEEDVGRRLTLASCGVDHGVRIFDLSFSYGNSGPHPDIAKN